jgi:hypothetical protein
MSFFSKLDAFQLDGKEEVYEIRLSAVLMPLLFGGPSSLAGRE